MAMDNDTLVYNSGALEELSQTINNHLNSFNDAVDEMFKVIDINMNQPDHWSGEIYDQLKDKCDAFRSTKIETMANNLKAYVDHFHKTSEESEETTTNVKGIVTRDAEVNSSYLNKPNAGKIGSYLK